MSELTLVGLRVVLEVARTGSFSAAAERLEAAILNVTDADDSHAAYNEALDAYHVARAACADLPWTEVESSYPHVAALYSSDGADAYDCLSRQAVRAEERYTYACARKGRYSPEALAKLAEERNAAMVAVLAAHDTATKQS